MRNLSVAVLITCYNRKQNTLDCLKSVFAQNVFTSAQITVYLVDDGCTDGTPNAVHSTFPQVNILQGTGDLFWTGGMQLAFDAAFKAKYDYYLWLNDDTLLFQNAIQKLLSTAQKLIASEKKSSIIVGAVQDPQTRLLSYGGVVKGKWWHPCRFGWLKVSEQVQQCDTMNGNCVLIPHEIAQKVGSLDTRFRHYAADFDYGLRAKKQGYSVWMAAGFVGVCEYNDPKKIFQNAKPNQDDQWQKLSQPKGLATQDVTLHPFNEWKIFTEEHAGFFWPIYWLFPYRRMLGFQLKKFFKI